MLCFMSWKGGIKVPSNRKPNISCDEDEEDEEESHYSLIRKPDGQADEGPYSTLR